MWIMNNYFISYIPKQIFEQLLKNVLALAFDSHKTSGLVYPKENHSMSAFQALHVDLG